MAIGGKLVFVGVLVGGVVKRSRGSATEPSVDLCVIGLGDRDGFP